MRLSINIDHIATLRNARGGTVPDPVEAALVAEKAGADGIVCHLREDRRHIRDRDVERLRKSVTTKLDLEMGATSELITIACRIRPDLATLVPERRQELTTEGGLDVARLRVKIRRATRNLHDRGIAVSLFIDPEPEQLEASKEAGADMIEIHTGEYANARTRASRERELKKVVRMATMGRRLGLGVNAGHGLDYTNIREVASVKEIDEVSIGHAIIVRAVEVGLAEAVREMVGLIARGSDPH